MFLSGEGGHQAGQATLQSYHMELYEGFTKCVSFWFWLEAGEADCVGRLSVFTEDTGGHVVSPWSRNISSDGWTLGQAAFSRGGDIMINFRAVRGQGSQGGFVALDDITINTFSTGDQDCDLLPPPEDGTTKKPCSEGEFTCGDGTCLPSSKVCNFVYDCDNDEEQCPEMTTFDDCPDLQSCYWRDATQDDLNWAVADVSQSPDNGPKLNFQNSTDGKFLLIRPSQTSVTTGTAELLSPIYRDSNTNCRLTFEMYLTSGPDGPDLTVYPVLRDKSGRLVYLDRLDKEVLVEGAWTRVMIGLGRQDGQFSFSLDLHYAGGPGQDWPYDAGIAVDDVTLSGCALPPSSEHCHQETEFHCTTTHGCIDLTATCDLADDCGDYSDEVFNCQDYIRFNFENQDEPFGFFNQDDTTPEFKWKRGNASFATGQEGTGPPFDHTPFTEAGHYLYIDSGEQTGGERAWLNSPFFVTSDQECRLRFFYHMHGLSVGNLSVYRE